MCSSCFVTLYSALFKYYTSLKKQTKKPRQEHTSRALIPTGHSPQGTLGQQSRGQLLVGAGTVGLLYARAQPPANQRRLRARRLWLFSRGNSELPQRSVALAKRTGTSGDGLGPWRLEWQRHCLEAYTSGLWPLGFFSRGRRGGFFLARASELEAFLDL